MAFTSREIRSARTTATPALALMESGAAQRRPALLSALQLETPTTLHLMDWNTRSRYLGQIENPGLLRPEHLLSCQCNCPIVLSLKHCSVLFYLHDFNKIHAVFQLFSCSELKLKLTCFTCENALFLNK